MSYVVTLRKKCFNHFYALKVSSKYWPKKVNYFSLNYPQPDVVQTLLILLSRPRRLKLSFNESCPFLFLVEFGCFVVVIVVGVMVAGVVVFSLLSFMLCCVNVVVGCLYGCWWYFCCCCVFIVEVGVMVVTVVVVVVVVMEVGVMVVGVLLLY